MVRNYVEEFIGSSRDLFEATAADNARMLFAFAVFETIEQRHGFFLTLADINPIPRLMRLALPQRKKDQSARCRREAFKLELLDQIVHTIRGD